MALEILVNDILIPTDSDISISLTYKNPLFTDKRINESFSYSFSLPATPTLNAIFKNAIRVDSTLQKSKKIKAEIKMSGVSMVSGILILKQTSNHIYSCNIINDGKDLYNELAGNHIKSYDFGALELWTEDEDDSLAAEDKRRKWVYHRVEVDNDHPETGKYKFPRIRGYYDSPADENSKVKSRGLNYVFWLGGGVNSKLLDVDGTDIPDTYFETEKNWVNTYSPCLRMDFIITSILNDIGFNIEQNDLLKIQEYTRLTNFSCYCADESVGSGGTFNIHGRKYELSDFLPNTNAWEAFSTLIEVFSCVFFTKENNITIITSKDILNTEFIDMSDRTSPEIVINKENELEPISFFYDIDKKDKKTINDELLGGAMGGNANNFMYETIGNKNKDGFAINHIPLRTLVTEVRHFFNFFNFYNTYDSSVYDLSMYDYSYVSFAFMKPRGGFSVDGNWLDDGEQLMLSSREFPEENDLPERFFLVLFHGMHEVLDHATILNPDGTTSPEFPDDPLVTRIPLVCNLDKTDNMNPIPGLDLDFPKIKLSDKHIYLDDNPDDPGKGTYSSYYEPLAEFKKNTSEIEKNLYLQPHEIYEMAKFRKPKHRINSKDGSFEGIVKEFKVQLSKHSISSTQITYLKKNYES